MTTEPMCAACGAPQSIHGTRAHAFVADRSTWSPSEQHVRSDAHGVSHADPGHVMRSARQFGDVGRPSVARVRLRKFRIVFIADAKGRRKPYRVRKDGTLFVRAQKYSGQVEAAAADVREVTARTWSEAVRQAAELE
jgi:hypothetical protein